MRPQAERSERRSRRRDMGALWRIVRWASAAGLAVASVVVLSRTETGAERLRLILATSEPARVADPTEERVQPLPIAKDPIVLRLSSEVRDLTLARDRLAARVDELERHLDDLTGSIKASAAETTADALERQALELDKSTAKRNSPTLPSASLAALLPSVADEPPPIIRPLAMPGLEMAALHWPDAPQVAAPTASDVPLPPVRHAAKPVPRVEFAVDLGGALTTAAINAQWAEAQANFGPDLAGLHAIALRDIRFGHAPYRLLAGPLPSVAAAARLCARLDTQRITCRPARFDGEPLAQP